MVKGEILRQKNAMEAQVRASWANFGMILPEIREHVNQNTPKHPFLNLFCEIKQYIFILGFPVNIGSHVHADLHGGCFGALDGLKQAKNMLCKLFFSEYMNIHEGYRRVIVNFALSGWSYILRVNQNQFGSLPCFTCS